MQEYLCSFFKSPHKTYGMLDQKYTGVIKQMGWGLSGVAVRVLSFSF